MPTFRPWADVLADAQKSGASPEQIETWRKAYNKVAPQYMAPLAPDPAAAAEEAPAAPDDADAMPQTAGDWLDWTKTEASKAYRGFKKPFEETGAAITKGLGSRAVMGPLRKVATKAALAAPRVAQAAVGVPGVTKFPAVSKEQAHAAGRAVEHAAREYAAPAVGGAVEYAPEMAALWASGGLAEAPIVGPYLAAARTIPYVGWIPESAIVGGGVGAAKRVAQGRAKEVDPATGEVIPPATGEDIVRAARQGAKGFVQSEAAARALGFAIRAPLKLAGIDWFEGTANRPESEGHGSRADATPPVKEKPADHTDDDDDGGGGGERGASGGSAVNTKKEKADPGLAARNERTDKPGSGAGGTDPDDDGGGGGGGGARVGGPTSRTVPPAVAPEVTETEGVPSQPVGPGSSDQKAMPETGEPRPRTVRDITEPETPESRRRGIEIAEHEYRWRQRQREGERGPEPEPLSPTKPEGPVRDYFKRLDEERRRQEADELNKQHTVTIGEPAPEPRNTIEYYRRLRGIPDVAEEPASRYEGLPRTPMEAGRETRPYQPPQPEGPVILGPQEQTGGGAFNRLMAQLRGEREPGGPGLPNPEAEARRAEAERQQRTAEQEAAERALRDARLDAEARRAEQERAYEQGEAGKRFVRKMTRGFGREEAPAEPLKGPVLEGEPAEPEAREPEPPVAPDEAERDKEAADRAARAAAALRHAREAEAEGEAEEPREPEKPKAAAPAPMTKARMLGIIQQTIAAMKEEHDRAGETPYWKSLRKSLRYAQKELDRLDREEREGGGGRPKPAAPGGRPGGGGEKVVIPEPKEPEKPTEPEKPKEPEPVEDEVPPPTDPEGKGPGHAPIVGTEDELHVEGFPAVRFRYEVVEARNVVASHNADFTPDPRAVPDLQGRNRDRAAMIAQVRKIRSKMNPPLLFDAPSAVQGAPLVGMDWNTEGGNGRVIAVKGLEKGNPQYQTYIDALKARLARFGIAPELAGEIDQFDQPLLIRRRLSHIPDADRGRFADATNADPGAHLSAGEKALADARRLTPAMLEHLTLSERGTLNTEANLPFIRQFLASLTEADANDHSTKEGYLNDAGLRRLQNAVITRAYVLGRELHPALDRMFESTDQDVKTIQNALLRAAPHFAAYRGLVDAGELPFVDVMTPLLDAASTVSALRNDGLTIRDWFDQGSLIPRPHALERAMTLYRTNTSVPDLHDALTDVANILHRLPRKSAGQLFGDVPEPPTPEQVFDLARDPRQARMDEEEEVRNQRAEQQLDAEIQAARASGEYDKVERLEAERKLLRDRKKPCP